MSLGDWLDAVLHDSKEGAGSPHGVPKPPASTMASLAASPATSPKDSPADSPKDPAQTYRAAPSGGRRFDDPLDDPFDAPGAGGPLGPTDPVARRLDRLAGAIGTDKPAADDDDPHSLRGIARRLDRLSSKMPQGPERLSTRETIRDLEERLHDIARRVESKHRPPLSRTAPPAAPAQPSPAPAPTNGLRDAIAEIASRQKTLEVEFDRAVSGYADRVDHRIDLVSERLERTLGEALPSDQLKQIREGLQNVAATGGLRASDTKDFADLRLMVTEMARRIETMPSQVADDLAERLEDTERRLDTATRSELDAIRGELREIAQDIDRRTRGEFESLRSDIRNLAGKIESMPGRDAESIEAKLEDVAVRLSAAARDEIGAIRNEVREIAEQVDLRGRDEMAAMRAEMARLADRIESLPASGSGTIEAQLEDIAARFDTATRDEFEAMRGELRDLGDRLLAERSTYAATNALDEAGLAELDAIRADIRNLAEQIDGVRRDDYTALRRDMQALGDRVTQAPESRMGDLEKQIAQLSEKLAGAAQDGDPVALAQIEQQISRLAETVDASSRQTADVGGLEQTITDMVSRIEDSRADTLDAARAAANEAIERALTAIGASIGDADVFGTLRDELASQRRDAEATGQRTHDALQVVHTTLMKVVDRLEELEDEVDEVAGDKRLPGQDQSMSRDDAGEPAEAPAVKPEPRLEAEPTKTPAASAKAAKAEAKKAAKAAAAAAKSKTGAASPDADSADAGSIEDDTPLVPGTGRPAAAPPAISATDSPADFIAAARRAAQAAVAEQSGTQDKAAVAKGVSLDALRSALKKYRRPLAIAAAMLVLVYGTMKIATLLTADPANTSSLDRPAVAGTAPEAAPRDVTANATMSGLPQASARTVTQAPVAQAPAPQAPAKVADKPTDKKKVAGAKTADNPKAKGNAAKTGARNKTGASTPKAAGPKTAVARAETAPASGGNVTPVTTPAAASAQPASAVFDELSASTTPELLRQAAAAGDPAAEFEVAVRYMDGRGLPHDATRAVEWYRKAAAQGLAPAQYRLGSLYEKGEGVGRDLAMARMWYQRAAEQGNRKAMHNLAVLYADGIDGKPDYEKAAIWFRQAAEYGLADSQFNLAVLFARGLGVQTNFAESFRWFAIAADQGDNEALAKRDEVASQLDQESLLKARAVLDAWTPKTPDASANVVPEPQGGWGSVTQARQVFIDRDMIMSAQSMLSRLGFTPGPADGQVGPRTRDAVRAFQRSVGMPDTGDITPELIEELGKSAG